MNTEFEYKLSKTIAEQRDIELEIEASKTKKEQQEVSRMMKDIKKELHHLAYQYGENCINLNKFINVNNIEEDVPANNFVASMDEFIYAIERLYNYTATRLNLLQKRHHSLDEELEELSEYNNDSDIPY